MTGNKVPSLGPSEPRLCDRQTQAIVTSGKESGTTFTYFDKPGEFFGSIFTIQIVKRVSLQHKNWG